MVRYSTATEDALFAAEVGVHVLHFHDAAASTAPLEAAAKQLRGEAAFAIVDVSGGAFNDVAEYFDVAPPGRLPAPATLAFHIGNGSKYVHEGAHEEGALVGFVRALQRGELAAHPRSQPEPAAEGGALLLELVGSTFGRVTQDSGKDVLVML